MRRGFRFDRENRVETWDDLLSAQAPGSGKRHSMVPTLLSSRLFLYLFIHLFICLFSFVRLFIRSFIYSFIYSFVYLFIYSSIKLLICSYIYLFVYFVLVVYESIRLNQYNLHGHRVSKVK